MKKNIFLAILAISLLSACQSESIPLVAPTSRPASFIPNTKTPTLPSPMPTEVVATPTVTPTKSPTLTASPTAELNPLAEVIDLQGDARWRVSAAIDWESASIGQALSLENQVLTRSEAKAVIGYLDGLLVRVAPKTLFTVTELQEEEDRSLLATIQMLIGQLFISHDGDRGSQIRIETEAGIAGVRGTMMSVKLTISGRMIVTCLEGVCTVENDYGLIMLNAGQQAEILNANIPPIFLGDIADYQLNEWFANQPEALLVALDSELIPQLPEGCDLDDSLSCQIELDCDPNTGVGCPIPEYCDLRNGIGCELLGGCNLATGEGCGLPPDCDPSTGEGCQLETGCNLVGWWGCAQPLHCDIFSGRGCQLGADCNSQSGLGCELISGCNPVTGDDCECLGGSCAAVSNAGQPASDTTPSNGTSTDGSSEGSASSGDSSSGGEEDSDDETDTLGDIEEADIQPELPPEAPTWP